MSTESDRELIRTYVDSQSNAAFAELVNRHLGLVYASALRQVQSPDVAKDIAQAVFLLLARKAADLPEKVILSGWLFRSTCFIAARVRREEGRRRRREQEAAEMIHPIPSPENELWRTVEPHLDQAMADLGPADRDILLLRFFEQKRMREVGEHLGVGEDAAKKRVGRAVEKLRSILGRRGVVLTGLMLAGALEQMKAQAAPAGLAQAIQVVTGTGAVVQVSITGLVSGAARDWLWLETRKRLVALTAAAAIVAGGLGLWQIQSAAPPTPFPPLAVNATDHSTNSQPAATASAAPRSVNYQLTGHTLLFSIRDKGNNQPIAGARVIAVDTYESMRRYAPTEFAGGTDGACEVAITSQPFRGMRIFVSAPGYVPICMSWKAYEFREDVTFYTCHLARGTILKGDVVDEDGKPVAGAKVNFVGPGLDSGQRENIAYHYRLNNVETDERGHFECNQISAGPTDGQIGVNVGHPDYASTSFSADTADLKTNRVIVLRRGFAFSGRIVNARGDAVSGAKVEDTSAFSPTVITDADGRFEFAHAAPEHDYWVVNAEGYARFETQTTPRPNAPSVTWQVAEETQQDPVVLKPTRLVGRVVDAENGEPIPRFEVLLEGNRGAASEFIGEGVAGGFDWTIGTAYSSTLSLQLVAPGYWPAQSDTRPITGKDQEFEFRMKRHPNPTGIVLQPDGRPAAGAAVALTRRGFPIHFLLHENGVLQSSSRTIAPGKTDANGRFMLHPVLDADQVLVAHETGCAILPASSATNVFVPLQPWGGIDGVVLVGNQPAPGIKVHLMSRRSAVSELQISFEFTATSDSTGHFRFTQVPAGTHFVQRVTESNPGGRGEAGWSHEETVTVSSGETAHVKLGGKGRSVVGKLALSPAVPNYRWSQELQRLARPRADLADSSRLSWLPSDPTRETQNADYYLIIQPDGTFRVDDVSARRL